MFLYNLSRSGKPLLSSFFLFGLVLIITKISSSDVAATAAAPTATSPPSSNETVTAARDNDFLICQESMAAQLSRSHIKDTECQKRVADVYCRRLRAVEQAVPFKRQCPLDDEALASPAHAIAGHVPPADALSTSYREGIGIVPLGILILVFYKTQASLVRRLVEDLWDAQHNFLLHVDPKAEPSLLDDLRHWVACRAEFTANIFVRSVVDVKRSGASLLDAELYGLRELLRISKKWSYFLVLSDSDQLVSPPAFLYRVLRLHWGESFVNTEVLRGRPRSVAVECQKRVHAVRMGGHEDGIPVAPGLTLASGSQFNVLFREFAEFAASAVDTESNTLHGVSLAHEVLEEVRAFSSPDETYFQTLAVNSGFCTSHARYNFHFHDTGGNVLDEASQRYTDFPTGSPPVLGETHAALLFQVRSQQPIVFARKFHGSNSSSAALLDIISQDVRQQKEVDVDGARPSWSEMKDGRAWADAVVAAFFSPGSRVHGGQATDAVLVTATAVGLGSQLAHSPRSALEVAPAIYRLRIRIRDSARSTALNSGASVSSSNHMLDVLPAVALRSVVIEGALVLWERLAVPMYSDTSAAAAIPGNVVSATALSPLLWVRVGVGWDSSRLRFAGPVAVASNASALRLGLTAVFRWRPAEMPRRIQVRWRAPVAVSSSSTTKHASSVSESGSKASKEAAAALVSAPIIHVAEEVVPAWAILSDSRLMGHRVSLPSPVPAGWWSLEVVHYSSREIAPRTRGGDNDEKLQGKSSYVVGARRFFLFADDVPAPREAFELFFHSDSSGRAV